MNAPGPALILCITGSREAVGLGDSDADADDGDALPVTVANVDGTVIRPSVAVVTSNAIEETIKSSCAEPVPKSWLMASGSANLVTHERPMANGTRSLCKVRGRSWFPVCAVQSPATRTFLSSPGSNGGGLNGMVRWSRQVANGKPFGAEKETNRHVVKRVFEQGDAGRG